MKSFLKVVAAVYFIGFGAILVLNLTSGPVTPALSFVRAVAWPLWVTTGIPQGTRF